MKRDIDLDKLKKIAASDDEDPTVSTLDPQIRTSKFALFPDPKVDDDQKPDEA
jgi:hypothetical protein